MARQPVGGNLAPAIEFAVRSFVEGNQTINEFLGQDPLSFAEDLGNILQQITDKALLLVLPGCLSGF